LDPLIPDGLDLLGFAGVRTPLLQPPHRLQPLVDRRGNEFLSYRPLEEPLDVVDALVDDVAGERAFALDDLDGPPFAFQFCNTFSDPDAAFRHPLFTAPRPPLEANAVALAVDHLLPESLKGTRAELAREGVAVEGEQRAGRKVEVCQFVG